MIDGQSGTLSATLKLRGRMASVVPALKGGETVAVSVLRQVGPGRWAVLVRGRTLIATSDVELTAGANLTARVARDRSALLLRILPPPGAEARLRLPGDELSRAAARALRMSGLGVTAERLGQLRSSSGSQAGERTRRLRLAAEIIRKLPGLGPRDLSALLQTLGLESESDEEGGEGRRRRRPRERTPTPMGASVVREGLWRLSGTGEEGREAGLLRLFNHLADSEESWVVLPCSFAPSAGPDVEGSLRVLYNRRLRAVKVLVLGARAEGGPQWWFRLLPGAKETECRVYCDGEPEEQARPALLEALRAQLGNLGVRIADTVEAGARFDGFSPVEPGEPPPVDLQG